MIDHVLARTSLAQARADALATGDGWLHFQRQADGRVTYTRVDPTTVSVKRPTTDPGWVLSRGSGRQGTLVTHWLSWDHAVHYAQKRSRHLNMRLRVFREDGEDRFGGYRWCIERVSDPDLIAALLAPGMDEPLDPDGLLMGKCPECGHGLVTVPGEDGAWTSCSNCGWRD